MEMLLGKHTQGVRVGQPRSELRILRGKTGKQEIAAFLRRVLSLAQKGASVERKSGSRIQKWGNGGERSPGLSPPGGDSSADAEKTVDRQPISRRCSGRGNVLDLTIATYDQQSDSCEGG